MDRKESNVFFENSPPSTISEFSPFSKDFREHLLRDITSFGKVMHCPEGMEIIIGGMDASGFYYLKSGTVEVSYQTEKTKIVVALIGPGEFFGESGFFEGTFRVRDIRAVADAEIVFFQSRNLQTLQKQKPTQFGDLMMIIAGSISSKFKRVLEEREPMSVYAASLSAGTRTRSERDPVPAGFAFSDEGRMVVRVVENFKTRFFDLSCALQKDHSENISENLKQEAETLFNEFNNELEGLHELRMDGNTESSLWQYVFRETFPYVMRSRIAERSYFKPKGYAGDFMMIEMLYANRPDGDGKIGKLMDAWCLNSGAAKAVRGRRELLRKELASLSKTRLKFSEKINIMNLACGPSRELVDFIKECSYSKQIKATCIDIDPEALEYTNNNLNSVSHEASISLMSENLIKWCIGNADHTFEKQDIIYSSGLMDYLDNRLFKAMIHKCYEQLKPGGVLMLGNFSPENPIRMFMDNILDWRLIYRDKNELHDLFTNSPFGKNVKIISEELNVNLFAVATK